MDTFISKYFNPEEYLLADKAYALERHIITLYKEPAARQPVNAAFNFQLSIPRVKIEHAFGILKARWPTLYDIPIQIGLNKDIGHKRVINWTMSCLVLHNILHSLRDDEKWLEEQISDVQESMRMNFKEQEVNREAKKAGMRRRDELRDLVTLLR